MIMAGKSVTSANDQIRPVSLEYIYQALTKVGTELEAKVKQLRALKAMHPEAFRKAKTQLPYLVFGKFEPGIRRKENFAFTEYVMIDVDKLSAIGLSVSAAKDALQKNPGVVLLFVSPGNDGIKALFKLDRRIHNPGYYSLFYKKFAANMAAIYKLEGAVDLVTSDVSRCCFMSYDPDAYFNPEAIAINPHAILDPNENQNLFSVEKEIKQALERQEEILGTLKEPTLPLADEVLAAIKMRIDPLAAKKPSKDKKIAQTEALEPAVILISNKLPEVGIELLQAIPISYGRQLKLKAGKYEAQVNLYHGQAGFKAVPTTLSNTNEELAKMAAEAILAFLNQEA